MPTPPTNAGRKLPAEPLSKVELRELLAAISNRSSSGIRLRAVVGALYGAGLRVSEALALMPRDVDTQRHQVRVRNGKGRKARTVGIDPASASLLDRWLDRRQGHGLNGRHPVFATYEAGKVGQPLDPRYVRLALARAAARAGLEKRVHPHGLRHSLASHMVEEGHPLHMIQAQLGHESAATTDRYLRQIAPAELIAGVTGRTWMD